MGVNTIDVPEARRWLLSLDFKHLQTWFEGSGVLPATLTRGSTALWLWPPTGISILSDPLLGNPAPQVSVLATFFPKMLYDPKFPHFVTLLLCFVRNPF